VQASNRKILLLFLVPLMLAVVGTAGYMIIEGFSFIDAFYMTFMAITTVGFGEVHPLSTAGRLFTIFLLITSLGLFAYTITALTQFLVSGELNKYFKTRKLMHTISQLHNHVIICGFGRNGQQACATLHQHNTPFVIIESSDEVISNGIEAAGYLYVKGDATSDEVLYKAGIDKAKALISALPVDADNVFIVLSARGLNASLQIISRASQNASYPKLKKAGANNVIMPDKIGGAHMASLVSRPDVIEFLDYISGQNDELINLEVIDAGQLPESLQERTLGGFEAWDQAGIIIIGCKLPDGRYVVNPSADTQVVAGMKIFVLGNRLQLEQLRREMGRIMKNEK
jgi:voltage-gated potassium channel